MMFIARAPLQKLYHNDSWERLQLLKHRGAIKASPVFTAIMPLAGPRGNGRGCPTRIEKRPRRWRIGFPHL